MPSTVWKGLLSFGLVSIPVRLHRAARKERIPLRYLSQSAPPEPEAIPAQESSGHQSKDNVRSIRVGDAERAEDQAPPETPSVSRVKQSLLTEDEEPVSPREIRKGYEVAPGQYVIFDQPELQRLRRAKSSAMEIVRSVRLTEIDPVFFETSYYVAPEPLGERAYGMLYSALRDTGYVALATVAMHGRDHVVLIRPGSRGLLAHTMFYVNEVRPESEYSAKTDLSSPKEVDLAKTFVEALAGPFAPEEFQDTHNRAIQQLISEKTQRGEVATAGAPTTPAAPVSPAPVTDIMEALRKSLELRKPVIAETKSAQPAKAGHAKRTPRKRA